MKANRMKHVVKKAVPEIVKMFCDVSGQTLPHGPAMLGHLQSLMRGFERANPYLTNLLGRELPLFAPRIAKHMVLPWGSPGLGEGN